MPLANAIKLASDKPGDSLSADLENWCPSTGSDLSGYQEDPLSLSRVMRVAPPVLQFAAGLRDSAEPKT